MNFRPSRRQIFLKIFGGVPMKQLITIALITLFCASCSDYPSSGGIDMDILQKRIDGEIIINQSLGVVVELDQDVVDAFKKIRWHELDISQVLVDQTHQPNFDDAFSSGDHIKEAITQYLRKEDGQKNGVNQAIQNWKTQVEIIKPEVEQIYHSFKVKHDEYLGFIKAAKDEWDHVNATKQELDQQKDQILKSIVTETNNKIVSEKLPFNKLREHGYSLKYKQVSWGQTSGVNCHTYSASRRHKRTNTPSYPKESYVVADKLRMNKSCYYITRPIRGVVSDDYDAFVKNQFDRFLTLETSLAENKEALKTAQKSMSDARIIAKNQTDIDFEKNNQNMQKIGYVLNDINWVLSDLAIDTYFIDGKVDTNQFNKANTAHRNIKSHLKKQGRSDQIETLNQIFKGMKIDALGKWKQEAERRDNYRKAVTEYINSLKSQVIKEHTIESTDFDDDCTFDGLDGGATYVVAVASCHVNSRQGAFRHFFDMSLETHGYKDKDDLFINPIKSAINPKNVTKDNLVNLLIHPLERGLDDQLDQVDVDFKNQLTGKKK